MHPASLLLLGLIVQAVVLGLSAFRLLFLPLYPVWLRVLPLLAVVGYNVFAFFVHPKGLNRNGPVMLAMWLDAWRFIVLVLSVTLVVGGLLHVETRLRAQLQMKNRWDGVERRKIHDRL